MEYLQITDFTKLYDYYNKMKAPFYFDVDYTLWLESFNRDTDYDNQPMFKELFTYAAICDGCIVGFIQFGRSNYVYDKRGEKDYTKHCGVIRNLYFDKNHDCGDGLVEIAEQYFTQNNLEQKSAFFHALGMTCNAGHGKLFTIFSHVEATLLRFGYYKEHENVYYKRLLTEKDKPNDAVSITFGNINVKGLQEFKIFKDKNEVGAGAIVYLPQGKICYLKWIYIYENAQGTGIAPAALNNIFAALYNKGITRIDTDTADNNLNAQKLYIKSGFIDMGRTRSYLK